MDCNKLHVARQSFGTFKIRKDRVLFELCLWKKKERRKKKKEKRRTKSKFSSLVSSNLIKVSETFGIDTCITLEY